MGRTLGFSEPSDLGIDALVAVLAPSLVHPLSRVAKVYADSILYNVPKLYQLLRSS